MTRNPSVGVCILNWNSGAHLVQSVRSAYQFLTSPEQQLVVVDNSSTDGSIEQISRWWSNITILRNPSNIGYGRGNNVGADELIKRGFRFLLFMNPDVILFSTTLTALEKSLQTHPNLGCIGGVPISPDGTHAPVARNFPSFVDKMVTDAFWHKVIGRRIAKRHFVQANELSEVTEVYALGVGACVMYRTEAFIQAGGFDDQIFLYSEELIMAERLARAGWRTGVSPSAQYCHIGGASTRLMPFKRRIQQIRSEQHLVENYYRWNPLKCKLLLAIRGVELAYYAPKSLWVRLNSRCSVAAER
jgi:GT2 family glycosyltransferase